MNNTKIQVKNQWDEKYLRENWTMPFGSMCNFLGQAFQGRGIDEKKLEKLARKIFELAFEFTERAYNKIEKIEEEPDIKVGRQGQLTK